MRVSDNRDRDSVEDYLRDRIKVLEREVCALRAKNNLLNCIINSPFEPQYARAGSKPRPRLAQIRIEGNTKK